MLHVGVAGAIAVYILFVGRFHGGIWGNNESAPGAIQATLVSSAAIPLPSDQTPTDNVLATEHQSPAPAPPTPEKAAPPPPPDAIPIPEKQKPQPKVQAPQKQENPMKQSQKTMTASQSKHPQPIQKQTNRAFYGEAAQSNLARSTTSNPNGNNPVAVNGGDFGSRFPWYVDIIRRKTAQNWLTQEVASGTPAGARVFISFLISRDGSPSQIRVGQSSGSPSLDSSCLRAVQRVDSYGPLPAGYNGNTLSVSYYCEQPGQ